MKIHRKPAAKAERPEVGHDPAELFAPIVGLLLRSGVSETDLTKLFKRALRAASSRRAGPKVYRVETKNLSADLLHRWMRNPKYLNELGKPIDLPLRGSRSVASLMRESSIAGSPERTLAFLLKFKNVRRTKKGEFRLLRRSLNFKISNYLPFEPNYEFMVDAARACTRGIGVSGRSAEVFWQRADTLRLSPDRVEDFLEFAETKGMLFMHEVNDWLDQHAGAKTSARKRPLKVGVGYFGICRSI